MNEDATVLTPAWAHQTSLFLHVSHRICALKIQPRPTDKEQLLHNYGSRCHSPIFSLIFTFREVAQAWTIFFLIIRLWVSSHHGSQPFSFKLSGYNYHDSWHSVTHPVARLVLFSCSYFDLIISIRFHYLWPTSPGRVVSGWGTAGKHKCSKQN